MSEGVPTPPSPLSTALRPFHIGKVRLANNLILAPMAGVTDRPFRDLCRRLGAGLAVSEMVAADPGLWASRKSQRRLDHRGETVPISAQILGNEPEALARAARIHVDQGADIIDINMGCPARKVCRKEAGSALLRDELLVGRILRSVVAAVPIPVTLKIRTGWSPDERNALAIARIAWESGIAALTVHGRTRACGFSAQAEYETIRAIRCTLPIPLVANGDIDTPEKAGFVLDYTGADAIMIGRGALGRPWIFQEVSHYLLRGSRRPSPRREWVRDLIITHLHDLDDFYGGQASVRIARKHVGWYLSGLTGSRSFRARFNQAGTLEEQQNLIESFFDEDKRVGEEAA